MAAPHADHKKGADSDGNRSGSSISSGQLRHYKQAYDHVVDPAEHHGPGDFQDSWRRGVVTGYHLGFRSLADENREPRRPSDIPVTDGFFKSFYLDFHYANQEFNDHFFKGQD